MKKVIKLTESDLMRIVKRVIKEQGDQTSGARVSEPRTQSEYKLLDELPPNKKNTFLDWYSSNPKVAVRLFSGRFVPSKLDEKYIPMLVTELIKLEYMLPNTSDKRDLLKKNEILKNTRPSSSEMSLKAYLDDYIINQGKEKVFFDKVTEIFKKQMDAISV